MPGTLPDLALCISSPGCLFITFIIFFNKFTNVSVSLSSNICSSKLIEPEEGVLRASDLWSSLTEVMGNLEIAFL